MSTQGTVPFSAGQGPATETCPCCGQQLLTQEAVRHLLQSTLEHERRLEAAARARVAQFANEQLAKLEAQHPEKLERLPGQPDEGKEQASAYADYAKALDDLRRVVRQF